MAKEMTDSGTGGDFLARRSDMTRARQKLPSLTNFLIVDDLHFDVSRIRATLHIMFGYEVEIRSAGTLSIAMDLVTERLPELIFLDDYLEPLDTALNSIPYLRRGGYEGPIIIVSSEVTQQRRAQLMASGASDVIHKDDLDTERISEALTRAFK